MRKEDLNNRTNDEQQSQNVSNNAAAAQQKSTSDSETSEGYKENEANNLVDLYREEHGDLSNSTT